MLRVGSDQAFGSSYARAARIELEILAMMNRPKLDIDIYSDIVCPWCYIGQRRLEKAMRSLRDIPLRIRRRPFFLEPRIPREGIAREAFIVMHFGSMKVYSARVEALIKIAASEGISYRPDLIRRQPNTLDCHRLVHWAAHDPVSDKSERMETRLMELFLSEGADLTNVNVLIGAAEECELDPDNVRRLLASDVDINVVEALSRAGAARGISGIPTYVFDDQHELSGARSPDMFVTAIRRVIALREARRNNVA